MDRNLIRQQEDELFQEWEKTMALEEGMLFIPDGVVCPEKFENIVFMLKEVHSKEGETQWDLRDFVSGGQRWQTWNNVARWTAGLSSGFTIAWEEIDTITEEKRRKYLKKISSMNVKKISGKPRSNTSEIKEFAEKDNNFLKRQLSLYEAKYIICCGQGVGGVFLDEIFPESKQTSNGVWYRDNGKTILIYFNHPQVSKEKKELYEKLGKAVHEIEENRSC